MRLTEAQERVGWMIMNGFSDREIADKFGMAMKTVKNHTTEIRNRLQVEGNRVRLAISLAKYFKAKGGL